MTAERHALEGKLMVAAAPSWPTAAAEARAEDDGVPAGGTGTRRRFLARSLVTLVVASGLVAGALVAVQHRSRACRVDPVSARALADLAAFTSWLERNDAKGYVGEVGWPSGADGAAWNAVASRWYRAADAAGLWVTAWAAGRWWPTGYPMAVYRVTGTGLTAGPQASVIERHATVSGQLHGVNLPGGSFGTAQEGDPDFSSLHPGIYGTAYYYESYGAYRQLAARGVQVVRLAVSWERLQPSPSGALNDVEIARLKKSLDAASRAGVGVILDLHNFGSYWAGEPGGGRTRLVLGSPALPASTFADLWRRLAAALKDEPAMLGYGLMNEPSKLAPDPVAGAKVWQDASQAAVSAIRAAGDQHVVLVSGYGSGSPTLWTRWQPRAWISDPTGLVRYEAHQYFDSNDSGQYRNSYPAEEALARAAGFRATSTCSWL